MPTHADHIQTHADFIPILYRPYADSCRPVFTESGFIDVKELLAGLLGGYCKVTKNGEGIRRNVDMFCQRRTQSGSFFRHGMRCANPAPVVSLC